MRSRFARSASGAGTPTVVAQRHRFGAAELGDRQARQPLRQAVALDQIAERIARRIGQRRLAALGHAAQERVGESGDARPAAQGLAGLDRLVDRGVRRDAIQKQDLVRGHAQHDAHPRVEPRQPAVGDRLQRAVEAGLPAQDAVDQLGAERALLGRQRARAIERRRQRAVGEGALALHLFEHGARELAAGGDRRARRRDDGDDGGVIPAAYRA